MPWKECNKMDERLKFVARLLDLVIVKGKTKSVLIYELLGPQKEVSRSERDALGAYHDALRLYLDRQWDQAISLFESIIHRKGKDSPSEMMIERCRLYLEHPPPSNWNGEYRVDT